MARLIFVSGPGAGGEHFLEGARISIGRDPANTIVLDDSLVSKRHCEIVRDTDGSLRIIDVGSSNGTLVNDLQVSEHRLAAGDTIQLGNSRFRYEVDPAAGEDEAAKTVLIDDAATRLAIPADAVQAARSPGPQAPGGSAPPESTIYISDNSSPPTGGESPPAAGPAPGTLPPPAVKTSRLPVMPILLCFIAVMIVIGIVLTWQVVRRSSADSADGPAQPGTAAPAVAGGTAPEEPMLVADAAADAGGAPEGVGAGAPVSEENLIDEPSGSEPVAAGQPQSGWPAGGQATGAVTAPPKRPAAGSAPPPRQTTPPPENTYAPPSTGGGSEVASPPPARPVEVPLSGGTETTSAASPPPEPLPARPRPVVPDATHGVLHVLTKPEGATIYINEEVMGTTNSKKLMSPGKYIIRLEYQGQSITDDVKVKEEEVSTFYHDFTPPPPGTDGEKKDDEDEDEKDKDEEDAKDKKEKDKEGEEEEDGADEDKEAEDEEEEDEDEGKKKKFKDRLKDLFG